MASHRLSRHPRTRHETELNLVPLIDVFTVLVFFLLVTAVFSRTTILGLSPPAQTTAESPSDLTPHIEVVMRRGSIEAGDRNDGPLSIFVNKNDTYDLSAVSALLQELKAREPKHRAVTLLVEPDISYDQLVQLMDAVRVVPGATNATRGHAELFPDISIGDAPVTAVVALGQGR